MKIFRSSILIILLAAIAGCNTSTRKTGAGNEEKKSKESPLPIPPFNADSAYAYVKAQVDFGPRVNNTKAHEKCAVYLVNKLKQFCPDVTIQSGVVKAWNGTILNFKNIIASYNPSTNNRIFLCSHWDSRPYADHDADPKKHRTAVDGANDGASGVGILIEIARQYSISKPGIGVDIILLDAEDYGPPEDQPRDENSESFWGLGSQYWAKTPHKANYFAKYGILLDMVGAAHATFMQEGFSLQYAPDIVKNVWTIAGRLGYSDYFPFEKAGYIDDDHYYINKTLAIPTIDIIHLIKRNNSDQTDFYPWWHTTKDDMNSIDKTTLDVVGKTLMAVIANEK
jgi:Zn-dependent M28 family amino/carboxypeptidase